MTGLEISDFILADVKTLKQMIGGRPELLQFDEFKKCIPIISVPEVINMWMRQRNIMRTRLLEKPGVTIRPLL